MMMTNFKWSTILLVHVLLLLIVTEIYASHIPPPPENIVDEFQEQRNDLVVDKVKKIVYGWRKLNHEERNQFKNQVKERPDDHLRTINDQTTPLNSVRRAHNHSIYDNITIYSYKNELYYYPIIEWDLDMTPDTDDYWIGIYKAGALNSEYLAKHLIGRFSKGTWAVGQLPTTAAKESRNRYEQYEVRIFKGSSQRLDAISNKLHGLVLSSYININPVQETENGPKIEPKLKAFLSTIDAIEQADEAEELLSASYYSQEELLQLWSEFNKQEQELLFSILEQDSLPDEIKKPSKTQSEDDNLFEPSRQYPYLDDNSQALTRGIANEPKLINLTISVGQSKAYVYPVLVTNATLPGTWAWLGIYRSKNTNDYNPNANYLTWQWVGPGYKRTTFLSRIGEDKFGPIYQKYVGVVIDWFADKGAYEQIGFSTGYIQAYIYTTVHEAESSMTAGLNANH